MTHKNELYVRNRIGIINLSLSPFVITIHILLITKFRALLMRIIFRFSLIILYKLIQKNLIQVFLKL
jgi:hypothetical protein